MVYKTLFSSACLIAVFAFAHANAAGTCEFKYEKVGCYHDRIIPNRPYPYELVNRRDPISKNWDGQLIDWNKWPQSLRGLACKCAELAKAKGYKYFGLQFYGECWSGPSERFYRDGKSDKCIGNDYKPCDDKSESECVGIQMTNYIYKFKEESSFYEDKVDGKWSDWSGWTRCSHSCGGGEKVRERICNNPAPSGSGAECVGEAEEVTECNTDPCMKKCNKEMEIGILLDSSSSLTKANWTRTIDFTTRFFQEFKVSEKGVHFGVLHFARRVYFDFAISDKRYWNPKSLTDKVKSIRYTYGGTRIDLALQTAFEKFFCQSCGLRPGVPKLVILITDGRTAKGTSQFMKSTAGMMKGRGIRIVTVGVGHRIDRDQLEEVATDSEHAFLIEAYPYLIDHVNNLLKVTCYT